MLDDTAELPQNFLIQALIGKLVEKFSLPVEIAQVITYLLVIVAVLILSWLANLISKKVLLVVLTKVVRKTKNTYDDIFLDKGVFNRLSHLAPALVISICIPLLFPPELFPGLNRGASVCVSLYLYIVVGMFLSALVTAVGAILESFDSTGRRPTKGYVQAIKLVLVLVVFILIISSVLDKSPGLLLSSLGALTAILLLIFKDTILGFVAGIQLSFNNMVKKGDWISIPFADADGDVIDVTLTTISVQNWDKTITFVPIYSLVTNAFTNWRGMYDSGGRRIKRSLHLDMTSVRFLDQDDITYLSEFRLLTDYLTDRQHELSSHRQSLGLTAEDPRNARHLTNLGTFRAYVTNYLKQNPMIHKEMTFLVRYLQTTSEGLPLEIYVFSKDQVWANYEVIQADIIDHLLAILPEFGLRIYQNPSGHDFARLTPPLPGDKT